MKTFLALLRIDVRWVWSALFFSVYIGAQNIIMNRTDQMFSLNMMSNGSDIFLLIIPAMGMSIFFAGARSRNLPYSPASPADTQEFLFSRAINRSQIFCSKSSIYVGLVLLPVMTIWIYSLFNPLLRVELPYNPPGAREITKDFYLQHFEGAYFQNDEKDKEGNRAYVVLPTGKATVAEFTLLWALAATLLLEIVIFAAPSGSLSGSRPPLAFLILLGLVSYMGWPSGNTPSRYEACLAWVSQHTFLSFLGLALFAVLSQLFCCRRFVRLEITS